MAKIALVISDVDGTLVTSDKRLTERTRAAVAALHDRGIGFTIVSSRPAFGLKPLIETLRITDPVAAFNGGLIATPALQILSHCPIGGAVAREILDFLAEQAIEAWLFTAQAWHVQDPSGPYCALETRTVAVAPRVVPDFAPLAGEALKIVGVSSDFARLEAVEKLARERFAGRANAVRSQRYYLDFVALGIDKGFAVTELTKAMRIPLSETITFGDMENDVPMFRRSAFSVAMGNASDVVKAQAHETTLTNDEDGFAAAIERYVLPRAAG